MKGQLNIEFIAAVLIFAVLATYTAFFVYKLIPGFSLESEAETIRAKTYQISDLLIGDAGIDNGNPPTSNWDRDNVKRVGLSIEDRPYVLDYNKITELANTGPDTVRDGFFSEYNMRIVVTNITSGADLANVGNGDSVSQAINILRIAPVRMPDGSMDKVRIVVTVWRA